MFLFRNNFPTIPFAAEQLSLFNAPSPDSFSVHEGRE